MLVGSVSHLPLTAREKVRLFLDHADQAQQAADRATAERYIDLAYAVLSAEDCGEGPNSESTPAVASSGPARCNEMTGSARIM